MKKLIALALCVVTLFCLFVPVYASGISLYTNNVSSADTVFSISSTGKAVVTSDYLGKDGLVTKGTIHTKIQKKFGLIWITVDCGEWTDTSTATSYSVSHTLQLLKSGTYRAHVEFTIYGTGGSPDNMTTNIERTYTKP